MTTATFFMLVDDDGEDREIFEEVLQEVDSSVKLQMATDGYEALEFLSSNLTALPKLIFLDLNMPRMSGKECLVLIKGNKYLKHIPVVIYTTSNAQADVNEMLGAGAESYIPKPTDVKDLKKVLCTITNSPPAMLNNTLKNIGLPRLFE